MVRASRRHRLLAPVTSALAVALLSIGAPAWGQSAATATPPAAAPGAAAAPAAAPAATKEFVPQSGQQGKDVIWVPTPQGLVDEMLNMVNLTPQDYLIDLGSGDGRTVITAAKRGTRAHGIEYNPDMVALSQRNARNEGVAERATFAKADIFASDFSQATVISLFLLPHLNVKLRPILLDMKPGTRVVSNAFDMAEWQPDRTYEGGPPCGGWCRAYLWIVPAKVDGAWQLGSSTLELKQTFQMLDGTLTRDGQASPVSEARMRGADIQFKVGDRQYSGQVSGDAMSGTIAGGGSWSATRRAR